jgi:hypothetical protein
MNDYFIDIENEFKTYHYFITAPNKKQALDYAFKKYNDNRLGNIKIINVFIHN